VGASLLQASTRITDTRGSDAQGYNKSISSLLWWPVTAVKTPKDNDPKTTMVLWFCHHLHQRSMTVQYSAGGDLAKFTEDYYYIQAIPLSKQQMHILVAMLSPIAYCVLKQNALHLL